MARKLDNNQDYELTNVEKAYVSTQIIKNGIKNLKFYRTINRFGIFTSYTLFSGCALASGKSLSNCINNLNLWDTTLLLLFTPVTFYENYLAIQYLKKIWQHSQVIKVGKKILKAMNELENLNAVVPNDVVASLEDSAIKMKEYIKPVK